MQIVNVRYTVKADYQLQNEANIKAFIAELNALGRSGIHYIAFRCADTNTFMHSAFFESDEDRRALATLPTFKYSQEQLKANKPISSPVQEQLLLIDSTSELSHIL